MINEQFGSPKDIINSQLMDLLGERNNSTADHIFENGSLEQIISSIEQLGLTRVSDKILNGANAIVLQASNHQMIRIVAKHKELPRSNNDMVLQPIYSKETSDYRIEVLPKINTLGKILKDDCLSKEYGLDGDKKLGMASAIIHDMIIKNAKNGRFFFDVAPDNIALMKGKDGNLVPIILDSGAIIDTDKATDAELGVFSIICLMNFKLFPDFYTKLKYIENSNFVGNKKQKYIKAAKEYFAELSEKQAIFPDMDYKSAQEMHLQKLGLDEGIKEAKFTGDEVAKFVAERESLSKSADAQDLAYNPQNTVFARIVQNGNYRDEAEKIWVEAMDRHAQQIDNKEQKGICQWAEQIRAEKSGTAPESSTGKPTILL